MFSVPEGTKSEKIGDGKLARWVHYQRKHYNRGALAQDRIDKLNKIGKRNKLIFTVFEHSLGGI